MLYAIYSPKSASFERKSFLFLSHAIKTCEVIYPQIPYVHMYVYIAIILDKNIQFPSYFGYSVNMSWCYFYDHRWPSQEIYARKMGDNHGGLSKGTQYIWLRLNFTYCHKTDDNVAWLYDLQCLTFILILPDKLPFIKLRKTR